MRKSLFLLVLLSAAFSCSISADDMDDTILAFEFGYRNDHFKILTNPTENPLFVTKRDWKDVQSWTLGIYGETYTEYNMYFKGKISYGWVYKSDYFWESSLINSDLFQTKTQPHGRNYDAKISVGIPCWWNFFCSNNCCRECWVFIPLIGFSWDRMNFENRGRFEDDELGILKTKSRNHTVIYSPYIGFDLHIPYDCWRTFIGYEYHHGRMNSHEKIKGQNSFTFRAHDEGKGYGNEVHGGIGYQFWCDYEAFLSFGYTDWKINHGHDHTRFTFDDATTKNKIGLKKASWQSWTIAFDFVVLY